MEKTENQKVRVNVYDNTLELNCPENADTLIELMHSDAKHEIYDQSPWDDIIMNTQDPIVGFSIGKQYWYVQVGDTKIAMNRKSNADLIAKIMECDNNYDEF